MMKTQKRKPRQTLCQALLEKLEGKKKEGYAQSNITQLGIQLI